MFRHCRFGKNDFIPWWLIFIEKFVMKGKPFNRRIGKQLRKLGFYYVKGRPAKNFAVRDRQLVTSQNPFSNEAFSRLYRQALKAYELTL